MFIRLMPFGWGRSSRTTGAFEVRSAFARIRCSCAPKHRFLGMYIAKCWPRGREPVVDRHDGDRDGGLEVMAATRTSAKSSKADGSKNGLVNRTAEHLFWLQPRF